MLLALLLPTERLLPFTNPLLFSKWSPWAQLLLSAYLLLCVQSLLPKYNPLPTSRADRQIEKD
jgi:hypothetical protein